MQKKLRLEWPIVVEGKYDKIKLSSIVDAVIIETGGFALFNNEEKRKLIRRLSENRKIVILTDSDGAGFVIRNKLKGMVAENCDIINLYSPRISGKESRKKVGSKEGFLGVEGIDADCIRNMFISAGLDTHEVSCSEKLTYTKADIYSLGYSGKSDSASKRDEVLSKHSLPVGMSANAFLEVVNLLGISLE
jgi:ribonuclease M5